MSPLIRYIKGFLLPELENKIYIITYHGLIGNDRLDHLYRNFNTVEGFTQQVKLLQKYSFLTLEELMQALNSRHTLSRPHVVFTFDDGYKNNLIAADILQKFRKPAVFFISAGYTSTDKILWTAELSLLILKGSLNAISFRNNHFNMNDDTERIHVFRIIRNMMKTLPAADKNIAMDEIRQQYPAGEIEILRHQYNEFEMMNWNEIQQMSNTGFDIGSHGFWHELHHDGQPEYLINDELTSSKNIIESHTGKECFAFSFPNGNFRSSSEKELHEASYKMAFTSRQDSNDISAQPYFLNRITSNNKITKFKTSLRQLHQQA